MSLAYLRDTTRRPFRVGAIVTVQIAPHAPTYEAEIVGAVVEKVRVRDTVTHHISTVDVEHVHFPNHTL